MNLTDFFLDELDKETGGTRRTLENVPEGLNSWTPHEKSMQLGYLAALVATMPRWIELMVKRDGLDLQSAEASQFRAAGDWSKASELLVLLDDSVVRARAALRSTTDEHLMTPWKLTAGENVLAEGPRWSLIRDMVFNHLSHHRGQLTVYLRLNGAKVPSIYGPSADEGKS